MKPPIPLLDPRFKYTDSAHTDVKATFARIRREQERAAQMPKNVRVIKRESSK